MLIIWLHEAKLVIGYWLIISPKLTFASTLHWNQETCTMECKELEISSSKYQKSLFMAEAISILNTCNLQCSDD